MEMEPNLFLNFINWTSSKSFVKEIWRFLKIQKISLKIKPKIFHPKPNKELEPRPKIPFEMKP
jgi:hypothetical protein